MRTQRFTARKLENVATKPGCWNKQLIGVFDGETKIGEYTYSYSSGVPFYAFRQQVRGGEDQWFALLSSSDYTKTDLMTLPDCKIIGGEELVPGGYGFCPVEFYVPAYYVGHVDLTGKDGSSNTRVFFKMHDDSTMTDGDVARDKPESEWSYELFGFRCGCVWGDDSSWKLQMLDLRRAPEGIITEIDIGYIELSHGGKLRDHLELHEDDGKVYGVHVSTLLRSEEIGKALTAMNLQGIPREILK